jgi:putative nucleotidyltransferase with HDIG domain
LSSGFLGGLVSAGLTLIFFFLIGNMTHIVTHIQLLELSRPTHPLLADLLRRAPGTYHHSLVVGNLAEQAAIRVGANAFLCRVGAYYHDVGKMARPYFFTENTPPGVSLHENLDPETSAQAIISHVTEGLRLAKKHRLPQVIHHFIAEHHGTELVSYFYHQAVQDADGDESQVERGRFCYPGPKPQTKETAILMLADASEATVRSVQPQSNDEIDSIVRKTIANRMKSGQFDECDMTMRDLEQVRIAFNEVLQGVSHPRVKYPEQVEKEAKVDTEALTALPLTMQATPGAINNEAEVEPLKPKVSASRQQ